MNRPATPTAPSPGAGSLSHDLYCPECGYNLRGLTSDRCPECGLSLEFLKSDKSGIPWERRRELGRFRAYWKTVWMVMFRHKLFRSAALRPVNYADAQRFRWVTIALVLLPPAMLIGISYIVSPEELADVVEDVSRPMMILAPVLPLAFLILATGLPSYFLHPRCVPVELQNRAIAMSYYTFAPLSWMWVPLVIVCVARTIGEFAETAADICSLLAVFIVPTLCLAWWFNLFRLTRAILRHPGAALRIAICVPVLWLLAGGLVFFGIPLVVVFILAIVYSFTG